MAPDGLSPGAAKTYHIDYIPTFLCVSGLIPGEPVDVVLQRPTGWSWSDRGRASSDGTLSLSLTDLPRRIAGVYEVVARQSGIEGRFTLQVDIERLQAAVLAHRMKLGQTARVFLAGGTPGAVLALYLYRRRAPGAQYWTHLGQITLNGRGEARLNIQPKLRDRSGTYYVVPAEKRGEGYVLVREPERYGEVIVTE